MVARDKIDLSFFLKKIYLIKAVATKFKVKIRSQALTNA